MPDVIHAEAGLLLSTNRNEPSNHRLGGAFNAQREGGREGHAAHTHQGTPSSSCSEPARKSSFRFQYNHTFSCEAFTNLPKKPNILGSTAPGLETRVRMLQLQVYL